MPCEEDFIKCDNKQLGMQQLLNLLLTEIAPGVPAVRTCDAGGAGPVVEQPMPIGNFLFVNPLGDDATGERENFHKPFKTLIAAKNAAAPGVVTGYSSVVYGSGYPNGPLTDQPTTGGTGVGLTVDYEVIGFGVNITINNYGSGYTNGDVVTITGGNNDRTITLIVVAAVDTIYVYGGTYNEANPLHKDGVKWHFVGKPILNLFAPIVFGDGGIDTVIEIAGDAIINHAAIGSFIEVFGQGTIIHADFHKVTGLGYYGLRLEGGSGVINIATKLETTLINKTIRLDGNASYVLNIPYIVNTTFIGGNNFCVTAFNSGAWTGHTIVNSVRITKGNHPTAAVAAENGLATGTLVVNVSDRIERLSANNAFPPNTTTVWGMGGNLIINGNIDGVHGPAITLGGGQVKTFEHNGKAYNNGTRELISQGANAGFWSNNNCKARFNGEYKSSYPITFEAGAGPGNVTRICGRIENTSNDLGVTNGIAISNTMGSVIIDDLIIIMNLAAGTPESIGAAVAKDIKVFHHLGTNANPNVNITNLIAGTNVTVDTDYE